MCAWLRCAGEFANSTLVRIRSTVGAASTARRLPEDAPPGTVAVQFCSTDMPVAGCAERE